MRTDYIPIDDIEERTVFKQPDGSPVRRFATTWKLGNLGFFRVYITIVGPQSEESQSDLSLCCSKAENILKAIPDMVILLNKKPRREDPGS